MVVLAGTFVTELLRREYPSALLLNCVVWPFESGEVCVQNYNTVLTMSRVLQVRFSLNKYCDIPRFSSRVVSSLQASDGVLLFENEVASTVCKKLLNMPSPSFDALNAIFAKALCMLLVPCRERKSFADIIAHLCPHPVSD